MKRWVLTIGVILVIGLLAGATFWLARLLMSNQINASGVQMMGNGTFLGPSRSAPIKFEPAPELPQPPDTLNGVFERREDNSFFVGTGNVTLGFSPTQGGSSGLVSATYDGPLVEVVVTRATLIYRDETPTFTSPPEDAGEQIIRQVIRRVDTLDEVTDSALFRVWGQRRGDRVVADVVVYQLLAGN